MMRIFIKKLFLVFSVLIIHSLIYSQLNESVSIINLPQGFVLDGLSGYGYNKTTRSTISNVNGSNPACVHDFYRRNASISYQFDSKIKEAWITDIGYSRIINYKPHSFAFIFPYGYFRISLAMSQLFNAETDYYGTRIDSTDPQGYITTGIFHLRKQEIIYKNSVTVSYNFLKLFHSSDTLLIGFRYNSNHLDYKYNIGMPDGIIHQRIFEPNVSIGVRYDLAHSEENCIKMGLYYETEIKFDKRVIIDNTPVQYIGYIPGKLHFGLMYDIRSKIFLSCNLSILFWENISHEYSSKKNQIELSGNMGYHIYKNLDISFGLFQTDQKYINNDTIFNLNKMKATYLLAGLVYFYKDFSFEIIIADSHLFSDEWRKQTIGKFAIGYNF